MKKKKMVYIMIFSLLVCAISAYVFLLQKRPELLEIHILNLNNTFAIVIRTPKDERILINGGANSAIVEKLTDILPFYSKRLDKVFASRIEGKYVSGLIDVLSRYKVADAYLSDLELAKRFSTSSDTVQTTFFETLHNKNIAIHQLWAGETIKVGGEGVFMNILFPKKMDQFEYTKASSPELLFDIRFGSTSMVFIGSASPKIQKALSPSSKSQILFTDSNGSPDKLAMEFIGQATLQYMIYRSSKESMTASRKSDPLAYMAKENRLNMHDFTKIVLVSDGNSWTVKTNVI